jgi:hypothetical protein
MDGNLPSLMPVGVGLHGRSGIGLGDYYQPLPLGKVFETYVARVRNDSSSLIIILGALSLAW